MPILIAALLAAPRAEATYSIAAVDTGTLEVGGAGTSCVGNFSVSVIYGAVPAVGVVHAQAYFNQDARDRAVQLLDQGTSVADIIADITSPQFDPFAESRQYGVVTTDGAAAAFTGSGADDWKGHTTGTVDRFAYSAQGNILTSENVIANTVAAFEGNGCDLAERLMLALEAGAMNGEGDARCTPGGIPSDGAFIRVDRAAEPAWLDLRVDDVSPMNPLVLLREQFDLWRAAHDCTEPPLPPDAGVPDLGVVDTGSIDTGVDTGVGDDARVNADASIGPGKDASQVADAGTDGRDEGCGCTTTRTSPLVGSAWLIVALLAVALRWKSERRTRNTTI